MTEDQHVQSELDRLSVRERLALYRFIVRYDLAAYVRRVSLRRLLGVIGFGAVLGLVLRLVEVLR